MGWTLEAGQMAEQNNQSHDAVDRTLGVPPRKAMIPRPAYECANVMCRRGHMPACALHYWPGGLPPSYAYVTLAEGWYCAECLKSAGMEASEESSLARHLNGG